MTLIHQKVDVIDAGLRLGADLKRLEPYAGKLARTVLRGLGRSNAPWLPDVRRESPGRLPARAIAHISYCLSLAYGSFREK